jgi:hypothetical protein
VRLDIIWCILTEILVYPVRAFSDSNKSFSQAYKYEPVKETKMPANKFTSKIIGAALTGAAVVSLYQLLIRPWHLKWGATKDETRQPLPGDELVPQPKMESTRAITIETPASVVWSWLAQIGQGRGGFYSYDWLENLIGCEIHTADHIVPEYQELKVGDKVRLGPEGYPFYWVEAIESGRFLVLHAGHPQTGQPFSDSWVFFLEPITEKTTRLLVRNRRNYEPNLESVILWRVLTEPAHFVMERKMLLGLKERAETPPLEQQVEQQEPVA